MGAIDKIKKIYEKKKVENYEKNVGKLFKESNRLLDGLYKCDKNYTKGNVLKKLRGININVYYKHKTENVQIKKIIDNNGYSKKRYTTEEFKNKNHNDQLKYLEKIFEISKKYLELEIEQQNQMCKNGEKDTAKLAKLTKEIKELKIYLKNISKEYEKIKKKHSELKNKLEKYKHEDEPEIEMNDDDGYDGDDEEDEELDDKNRKNNKGKKKKKPKQERSKKDEYDDEDDEELGAGDENPDEEDDGYDGDDKEDEDGEDDDDESDEELGAGDENPDEEDDDGYDGDDEEGEDSDGDSDGDDGKEESDKHGSGVRQKMRRLGKRIKKIFKKRDAKNDTKEDAEGHDDQDEDDDEDDEKGNRGSKKDRDENGKGLGDSEEQNEDDDEDDEESESDDEDEDENELESEDEEDKGIQDIIDDVKNIVEKARSVLNSMTDDFKWKKGFAEKIKEASECLKKLEDKDETIEMDDLNNEFDFDKLEKETKQVCEIIDMTSHCKKLLEQLQQLQQQRQVSSIKIAIDELKINLSEINSKTDINAVTSKTVVRLSEAIEKATEKYQEVLQQLNETAKKSNSSKSSEQKVRRHTPSVGSLDSFNRIIESRKGRIADIVKNINSKYELIREAAKKSPDKKWTDSMVEKAETIVNKFFSEKKELERCVFNDSVGEFKDENVIRLSNKFQKFYDELKSKAEKVNNELEEIVKEIEKAKMGSPSMLDPKNDVPPPPPLPREEGEVPPPPPLPRDEGEVPPPPPLPRDEGEVPPPPPPEEDDVPPPPPLPRDEGKVPPPPEEDNSKVTLPNSENGNSETKSSKRRVEKLIKAFEKPFKERKELKDTQKKTLDDALLEINKSTSGIINKYDKLLMRAKKLPTPELKESIIKDATALRDKFLSERKDIESKAFGEKGLESLTNIKKISDESLKKVQQCALDIYKLSEEINSEFDNIPQRIGAHEKPSTPEYLWNKATYSPPPLDKNDPKSLDSFLNYMSDYFKKLDGK